MMGHTDKATVNARRPLTLGMLLLLKRMDRSGPIEWDDSYPAERNQLRALMDRGYARPRDGGTTWRLTEEGRAIVSQERDHR